MTLFALLSDTKDKLNIALISGKTFLGIWIMDFQNFMKKACNFKQSVNISQFHMTLGKDNEKREK